MLFNKTLAGLLGLASLGAAYKHEDRADSALKLDARSGRLGRRCVGTGTAPPTPTPTSTCEVPDPTANPVDKDAEVCKCGPYRGGYTYGPYEISTNWYQYIFGGYARCDLQSIPRRLEERKVVPQNNSFQECIYACTGSFEKAKRSQEAGLEARQEDSYWFCHAVNFIEGELCEFVGEIDKFEYRAGGADTWVYPSFEPRAG